MATPEKTLDKVHDELNKEEEGRSGISLQDKIASLARQLLVSSQIYKQPRMNSIAVYERLYNNDVLPKLRQLFNVPIPIFSGMIDELLAMFNDQVQIKFKSKNPQQNLIIPKVQALWDTERDSMTPNAMWDYKARSDRFNAMLSGRGILKEYAFNDPEYMNCLEIINYSDFHCQPMGGGLLERHLFCGTEGNFKTIYELETNTKYDQEQVKKLKRFSWSDKMFQDLDTTYGTKFSRWKALGLNPENNSFAGEATYNLCDFVITYNGVRYNVVFEPCSGLWLYVEEWKKIMPSGTYPYKSWATHEDDKNFWSKSYADDFFPIADAVITLFNQELTNREKKNFNARAYDKDMFTDVAKLDAAQYRPDALVPVNTMGGAKNVAQGIYAFETPQLSGTINLIDWMSNYTGQKTGAEEIGGGSGPKKVGIEIAKQQKQSKRVGFRSDSFKECYAQLGMTYMEGLREFMPPSVSVQIIGENGFIEEQELKRIEVKKAGIPTITVTSSSEQESMDAMKKEGQIKAIDMVAKNPNLTRYEKETIYRNIGQFDESEIAFLLDTQGQMSKKQAAKASQAIQDILKGKEPEIYYGADLYYLMYIKNYLTDHKNEVKGKVEMFMKFIDAIASLVEENTKSNARNTPVAPQDQKGGGQPQPGQDGQKPPQGPQPMPKMSIPQVADKMSSAMQ